MTLFRMLCKQQAAAEEQNSSSSRLGYAMHPLQQQCSACQTVNAEQMIGLSFVQLKEITPMLR